VTVLRAGWWNNNTWWRQVIFFFLFENSKLAQGPTKTPVNGHRRLFTRRRDVKLTMYLYPVLRSRICGNSLLPLYAFKASIQTLCWFWVLARNYLLTHGDGSRLLRNVVSQKSGTVRLTNRMVQRSPCEMSAITQHAAAVGNTSDSCSGVARLESSRVKLSDKCRSFPQSIKWNTGIVLQNMIWLFLPTAFLTVYNYPSKHWVTYNKL